MSDSPEQQEQREQRHGLQKRIALKEDGYYSNCLMVEMSPFDTAILFGKIRPVTDADDQGYLLGCTIGRRTCLTCRLEFCTRRSAGARDHFQDQLKHRRARSRRRKKVL